MNTFGITEKSFQILFTSLSKYPQIEEVVIFGSRAKGNYKNGSDIDLALKGSQSTSELAFELQGFINEELPIPYHVDVVDYSSLNSKELKEHIDRVGKRFYPLAK